MTNFLAIVTFYCHCQNCNGLAGQATASGVMPERRVTVAAPRSVPLGVKLHVSGIGWRRVEDRMRHDCEYRTVNGRKLPAIDVFVGSDRAAHRRAKNLGVQIRTITIKSNDQNKGISHK